MINTISWKTYFVFMCLNFAFIPIIYFAFPETNGHKLEKLDAIFAEAYEKKQNPVFTERRYRKHGGKLDVEKREEVEIEGHNGASSEDDEKKGGQAESTARMDEHKEEI